MPHWMGKTSLARQTALAGVAYSVLTLLYFLPVLPTFFRSLIGPPEDNLQHLWDFWWFGKVLGGQGELGYTTALFYPEGGSLLFHSYSFYNLILGVLLKPLFGPTGTYNLLVLLAFVLAGMGAFMLVGYITGSRLAAFVGGFIYAFSPAHFIRSLHHIELASIQFIPCVVLCFIRTVRGGGPRHLAAGAVFFLLMSVCHWYYFALGMILFAGSCAYLALMRGWRAAKQPALAALGMTAPTVVLLSPWIARMAIAGLQHPYDPRAAVNHNLFVIDLAALFTPHPHHLLGATPWVERVNARFTGNAWEAVGYLGIVNLLVVAWAWPRIQRMAMPFAMAAVSFAVLSFGSRLHWLGRALPVPLPYEILRQVPLVSSLRSPARSIVYVYLFLAILVGLALRDLSARQKGRMARATIGIVVALMAADFFSVCTEATPVRLPPAYQVIRADPDEFGIADVYDDGYVWSARYMMYQTQHERPIIGGYLSRRIDVSLIDRLDFMNFADLSRQKSELIAARVKYIVLHKTSLPPEVAAAVGVVYGRLYRNVFDDAENTVFRVYGDGG